MDLHEFYTELLNWVPYQGDQNKPFKNRLEHCLDRYEQLIDELRIDGRRIDDTVVIEIGAICSKIKQAVDSSMRGAPSTAFKQIGNLFVSINEHPPKIDLGELVKSIDVGSSFYRVRKMDLPYGVKCKELFHIPIPLRGEVESYRFSSPGYPCLYLSESVYGCWEEMRRPPMFQCAVSRFRNETRLNVIDLTIPTEESMAHGFYQKLMPLVMACMIKVADEKAIYKPEYIVPQLLVEWVLKTRTSRDYHGVRPIHGVKYHSTQLNKEFRFPMKKMENYAIPVFSVDPKKQYCPKLCDAFFMTRPTSNEIEQLRQRYGNNYGELGITPERRMELDYDNSYFGRLESRLSDTDDFPLMKINYKTGEEQQP